jgi:hypothetical protein
MTYPKQKDLRPPHLSTTAMINNRICKFECMTSAGVSMNRKSPKWDPTPFDRHLYQHSRQHKTCWRILRVEIKAWNSTVSMAERKESQSPLNITIVGAGLAGLSAAISCSLAGHNVLVTESAKELAEVCWYPSSAPREA